MQINLFYFIHEQISRPGAMKVHLYWTPKHVLRVFKNCIICIHNVFECMHCCKHLLTLILKNSQSSLKSFGQS